MKTAVFCLTRGYQNPALYSRLISRNESIARFLKNAEVILFHEGNVSPEHQKFISSRTPELNIKWIQVPWVFPGDIPIPEESVRTFYDGSCYPGYHLMCEFHSCDVWDHLKEYDIVLRVDEDCILTSPKWSNVFESMDSYDYLTPMYDVETHDLTNKTLPEWLGPDAHYYDRSMPYTNVFISKTAPWFRDDVQEWLKKLKESHGCIKYRWGDHVLHSVVLKKFGISHGTLDGYSYYHGSHNRYVS